MSGAPDNSGREQGGRFRKGRSGNPRGCPTGSRHRATLAAEALLDGEAEGLTRKAIELALSGDMGALRLCMERLLPPRRDRPVSLRLPPLGAAVDAVGAMATITAAVAEGELTPSEAGELASLVSAYVKAIEVSELERRMAALEERANADTRQ